MTEAMQFEVTRESVFNLSRGTRENHALRVKYRLPGQRRWEHFVLVSGEYVADEMMPRVALAAIHKREKASDGEQ